MTKQTTSSPLLDALRAALGADRVVVDALTLAEVSNDVYRSGGTPLACLRPADVPALQEAVKLCAKAGTAMVPRGGGASYTDGYLYAAGGHVLIDTGAFDAIDVDAENLIVTVGAGTTWAALKDTLDKLGLRTPFWGPFSGLAATVGGSVSQNTLSHGSTAHGISAQSVLSMQVVLANGDLLDTGTSRAIRFYGPDLTGLFTGDCGAFGIKTAIRLPLIRKLEYFEALSFAFDDFAAYHKAQRIAQMERLDDTHFGIDLALSQGQIGRQGGLGNKLKIASDIMRKAPRKLQGLGQIMRMALAGEDPMRAGAYMCHFIVEGIDQQDASGKARRLRSLLGGIGREIANTIPTFVRNLPFAPLTNILGPGGERWVPVHGLLQHDKAVAFDAAFKKLLADRQAQLDAHGVWIGTMFSPVGSAGFLYEIALYWPDDRTAYHRKVLGEEYLAGLTHFPANEAARACAGELKEALIALYQEFDAAHFQIGRAYPYQERLHPRAKSLLHVIKSELDPAGLMNPGAIGF